MGTIEVRLGLAGTGKSEGIAEEIINEVNKQPLGARVFWVVPGAASYTSERRLLQKTAGTVRAEVIHLERLAGRANEQLQATTATPVNNTGKRLLLAAVYQECVNELQVLHRVEPSIRFLDAILEVFEEMSQFAVIPDQIEARLEVAASRFGDMDPVSPEAVASKSLIGKLRDISLLYVRWKKELRLRNLYDPSDLPEIVAPHLDEWAELNDMRLYIDGFSDITPRDASFIAALAERAEHTVVTLPLRTSGSAMMHIKKSINSKKDESLPWDDPIVLQAWMSFRRLSRITESRGLSLQITEAPVAAEQGRFAAAPDLARLNEFLRGDRTHSADWEGQIALAQAQNSRAECDGVATAIAAAVHSGACGFEDVAVLVPDMEMYSAQLEESFHAYGLPFNMDTYPALANHPLTKFLLASLMAVEENLSVEAMKRYLKTAFCGLTLEQADWLENYIQAYEVEGEKAWLSDQPWQFAQAQSDSADEQNAARLDARAESARSEVMAVFHSFVGKLQVQLTPAQLARALWELLVDAGAKGQVAKWLVDEGAGSAANPGEGSMHEQAWMKWMSLLNDLSETRAGKPMPRSFLFSLIYEECVTQSLTTIPAGLHQVRVMSFQHALAWEAKQVFVMGAADGALPARVGHQGILQDEERMQFSELFHQRLGYTTEERQAFQRLFVYSIFSRASTHLTLSAPLSNQDGKAIRPSLLFGQIKEWFGGQCPEALWTRENAGQFDAGGLANAQTPPGRLLEYWLPHLREGSLPVRAVPQMQTAMKHYLETEPWHTALSKGIAGLTHKTRARPLAEDQAKKLYGLPLYSNVHQLETFASCSYRYFLQYGLRLQPEEIPEITPAERGTLVHDVLQDFVAKHMKDPARWREMTDKAVQESIREVFEQVLQRPSAHIWDRKPSRFQQAMETLQLLQRAATVLTNHMRRGEFTPRALELSFGGRRTETDEGTDNETEANRKRELPLVTFGQGSEEEILLRGRVDRVDIAEAGDPLAIRIIDYKSSALDLDVTRIEHGLRLQLPLYGAAVAKYSEQLFGRKGTLAGLLYIPIQARTSVTPAPTTESAAAAEQTQNMRTRGWLLAEDTYLDWMDHGLRDGKTDLFKKIYKKDGSFAKDAPVLAKKQWESLLGRVLYHVQDLSSRLLSGQIDIQPYRLQNEESCTFCPYQAVCQIDKRWDTSPFRKWKPLSKDYIENWEGYIEYWEAFIGSGSDES